MHAGDTPIPNTALQLQRAPHTCCLYRGFPPAHHTTQLLAQATGSTMATGGSWVTSAWYRANLFLSSPSAAPQALCSRAEPSVPHLFLTPQMLLLLQSVPQQHIWRSYQPSELLFLNICKFGHRLYSAMSFI